VGIIYNEVPCFNFLYSCSYTHHILFYIYSYLNSTNSRSLYSRILDGMLLVEALGVLSAPLAGSVVLDVGERCPAVVGTNVLNILERDAGNEAGRLPGLADLAVELIDLLERQTLGLIDHGPNEECADEAESTPDEEDLSTEIGIARAVVDHVRCSVSDGEVEEPVA
jgi:hypothetical protein